MSWKRSTLAAACAFSVAPQLGCDAGAAARAQARVEAVTPPGQVLARAETPMTTLGATPGPSAPTPASAAQIPSKPAPSHTPSTADAATAADIARTARAMLQTAQRPLAQAITRSNAQWTSALSSVPELSEHMMQPGMFSASTAKTSEGALTRAGRSRASVTAWTLADGPFAWSPTADSVFVVVAGAVAEGSLVSVLKPTAAGTLEHAASLIVSEKDAPIAVAYDAARPTELLWTTCYGCPGEGGSVRLADDGRPVFIYR